MAALEKRVMTLATFDFYSLINRHTNQEEKIVKKSVDTVSAIWHN